MTYVILIVLLPLEQKKSNDSGIRYARKSLFILSYCLSGLCIAHLANTSCRKLHSFWMLSTAKLLGFHFPLYSYSASIKCSKCRWKQRLNSCMFTIGNCSIFSGATITCSYNLATSFKPGRLHPDSSRYSNLWSLSQSQLSLKSWA